MSQINYQLLDDVILKVGSSTVYVAVQQFGAVQGTFGGTSRNALIPWSSPRCGSRVRIEIVDYSKKGHVFYSNLI